MLECFAKSNCVRTLFHEVISQCQQVFRGIALYLAVCLDTVAEISGKIDLCYCSQV